MHADEREGVDDLERPLWTLVDCVLDDADLAKDEARGRGSIHDHGFVHGHALFHVPSLVLSHALSHGRGDESGNGNGSEDGLVGCEGSVGKVETYGWCDDQGSGFGRVGDGAMTQQIVHEERQTETVVEAVVVAVVEGEGVTGDGDGDDEGVLALFCHVRGRLQRTGSRQHHQRQEMRLYVK